MAAFVCHHNSLLIYGSLKTPTIDRFSKVTHYSTGVSMVACLVMAVSGFLVFGNQTLMAMAMAMAEMTDNYLLRFILKLRNKKKRWEGEKKKICQLHAVGQVGVN